MNKQNKTKKGLRNVNPIRGDVIKVYSLILEYNEGYMGLYTPSNLYKFEKLGYNGIYRDKEDIRLKYEILKTIESINLDIKYNEKEELKLSTEKLIDKYCDLEEMGELHLVEFYIPEIMLNKNNI